MKCLHLWTAILCIACRGASTHDVAMPRESLPGANAAAQEDSGTRDSNEGSAGEGIGAENEARTHESRSAAETVASTSECYAGDLAACHAAALDAYYAPPSAESDRLAHQLFQSACEKGYAPSCNGLGVLYAEGRGVKKDPAAAVELYRRACRADAGTGCRHLAAALRSGVGTTKNVDAAARAEARGSCLFQSSLKKNQGMSCDGLETP